MLITIEDADIDTGMGMMRCRVFRPQDASRRWPALILWAEIFGITGPIARSAQLFAGHGFVVCVPEFYHNFLPAGAALAYTPEDTAKGNAFKAEKSLASYDADIKAVFDFALGCPHANGAVGTAGFCLGGGLAFRAALHPACKAAVCWYATDVHKGSLSKDGDDSLARVAEIKGELVMMCVARPRAGAAPLQPISNCCTPSPPACAFPLAHTRTRPTHSLGPAAMAARTRTCPQRAATRCALRWWRQGPTFSSWRSMASTPSCGMKAPTAAKMQSWR